MARAALPLLVLLLLHRSAIADDLVIVEPSSPLPRRQPMTFRVGPVELTGGALVQVDASRGGEHPGFWIRRSRVRLASRLEKRMSLGFRLEVELSPLAEARGLLDAVVDFRLSSPGLPDFGRVALGQMKVPLSNEVLLAPEELPFVDRSLGARAIAPGRDIGILYTLSLPGGPGRARLSLGMFNGEGAGQLGGGGGAMWVARLEGLVGSPSRAQAGGHWGLAVARNPDVQAGAETGAARFVAADMGVHFRALRAGSELLWRQGPGEAEARAVSIWSGVALIPDTLELLGRFEGKDDGIPSRFLTLGVTFHYLADRFQLSYNAVFPITEGEASMIHRASFLAVL